MEKTKKQNSLTPSGLARDRHVHTEVAGERSAVQVLGITRAWGQRLAVRDNARGGRAAQKLRAAERVPGQRELGKQTKSKEGGKGEVI